MIAGFVLAFAVHVAATDALRDATLPSEPPRAIDRVLSNTPTIDAKGADGTTDEMTKKLIAACLQAHDNDASLCRMRATVETGNDVPRQRVEDENRRLDPTPAAPN